MVTVPLEGSVHSIFRTQRLRREQRQQSRGNALRTSDSKSGGLGVSDVDAGGGEEEEAVEMTVYKRAG